MMHPIAIDFGAFALRWYGVMAAAGFLCAMLLMRYNRKYAGLSGDQAGNIVLLALIGGIAGARIFYVIQFASQFRDNWFRVFRVDQGGLVFYGGFFLATAALIVYCRICKLDTVRVVDCMTPSLTAGHAFGRVGCFLNGCCFGKPTACLFGIAYPEGSVPFFRYGTAPLHPVQLYEACINIGIAVLMTVLLRRCKRGVPFAVYLFLYGTIRFCDEFFRGDHQQFVAGMTPAQTIGILLIPAGALLFWFFSRKESSHDAA